MTKTQAIKLITDELAAATLQHPAWPDDPIHAAGILNEEAGETMKAALDHVYFGADKDGIAKEATQCGAMAIRLLMNLR